MINKKTLFGLAGLLLASPAAIYAQAGLYISSGANLVSTNTTQIVVNDGDFINDGSFSGAGSTVVMSGSAAGTRIAGSTSTEFYNLNINKALGVSISLDTSVVVDHFLNITSGDIDLNSNFINLGLFGKLNFENELSHVTSSSTGGIISTVTVNGATGINPGQLGLIMTTTDNLGAIVVNRGHDAQAINSNNSGINRYYDLIETGAPTTANIAFEVDYLNEELNGIGKDSLYVWSSPTITNPVFSFNGRDNIDTLSKHVDKQISIAGSTRITLSNDKLPVGVATVPNPMLSVKTFPNPATDQVNLSFTTQRDEKFSMAMVDLTGKIVSTKKADCKAGDNVINWSLDNLASGSYYIMFGNADMTAIKIVKE